MSAFPFALTSAVTMATRSIYHKPCPSCAAAVSIEAAQCRCGYSFEMDTPEADMLPDDQLAQEQELLKEYLNARIAQAVDSLQDVQSALADDPRNLDKAGRLMKAYVALHELRTELETLSKPASDTVPVTDTGAATEVAASQHPTDAFRTAQAQKAEQLMKAVGMETKNCPKCRTVLPQRAALCFCGFAFTTDAGDDAAHRASDSASSVQLPIDR
jgi:hypothetical protein